MTDTDIPSSCLEALARHEEADRHATERRDLLLVMAVATGLSFAAFVAAAAVLAALAVATAATGVSVVGSAAGLTLAAVTAALGVATATAFLGTAFAISGTIIAWMAWREAVRRRESALTELLGKCPPELWP